MPNFTFTGPDGKQVTVTGPEGSTPAQAFQIMQQHLGQKQPGYQASDTGQFTPIQNAGQKAPAPTGNAALGALQGLSNAALGAGNAISAGAYATLKPHKDMAEASQNFDTANQFLQGNQIGSPTAPSSNLNTTDAARQAVQAAASTVAGAPQALYDAGVNKLGALAQKLPWAPAMNQFINQHPVLQKIMAATQGAGDVGSNLLPMFVGGKLAPKTAEVPELTPKQQILQTAQQKYGLKIAPGEAGGSPIASALEDVTGSAMAEKLATRKNQPVVNSIGANEIQQPGMPNFTNANLKQAKIAPNAKYNQVGSIGDVPTDDAFRSDFSNLSLNPRSKGTIPNAKNEQIEDLQNRFINLKSFDAQDGLNEIGDLRASGWKNMKAPNAPEQNRLGGAQLRAADALENQLDRYASTRPEGFDAPEMIQQWRDARTLLAKIHTVQANKVGTDLSVPKLVKAYANGAPLSDGLLDLAQIGEAFPNSLKDASRIRGPKTFTKWDMTFGGGGALGAMALGHPALAGAWGAGVLGQPLVRNALLSSPVQASMLPKAPIDPMFMRILMGGTPAALNANQGNQ